MANTPWRKLRAPLNLWEEFGQACEEQGTDRSTVLRAYMRRYVAAWKGRRSKPGPTTPQDPHPTPPAAPR